MKKTILLLAVSLLSVSVFSQDLETIVKKYVKASGIEAMENFKTTRIDAVASQSGMEFSMTILEQKPDKFRTEMSINGMQIITVINGDKGYSINPMMGSSEPVALNSEQIKAADSQKITGNNIASQFKEGKVELIGETEFDGKAAYKLKVATAAGDAYSYIDKKEYMVLGTEMEMSQNGQTFTTTIVMKDYREVKGYKMAHKMVTTTMGQTAVIEFTKVEFNGKIDGSLFEVK